MLQSYTRIPHDDDLTHFHPHRHLAIRPFPAHVGNLRIVLDCTSFEDAGMSHRTSSAQHRLLRCGSGRVCYPIPHLGKSKGDRDNVDTIV